MESHPTHSFAHIRGILFDMDGVLFDTMPFHAGSWMLTAKRYGLVAEEKDFYRYEGQPGRFTIRELYQKTFHKEPDEATIQAIYSFKTTQFLAQKELALIPHIHSVLDLVQTKGLAMGVVTGSAQRSSLDRVRQHFGRYFSRANIITGEDVKKGKPDPEPYLMGMQKIGTQAKQTIIIENAPLGVISGHSSGAITIGVTTGPIEEPELKSCGADYVFANMSQLHSFLQAQL